MISKPKLAKALCVLEKGKKQVDIAQMSEILKNQTEMMAEYLFDTYYDQLHKLDYDKNAPLAVIMRDAVKIAVLRKKKSKK